MTAYELQVQNTTNYYNQAMNLAESDDQEILYSYVPCEHVHEKVHNPAQEGIDEG